MRCFKFGHTSQRGKVAAKCQWCGKDKREVRCEGPTLCSNCNCPHASSAEDCLVWQKEKEIQRVRVEKRISFPEARQLVEAMMPTVVSGGKSYAAAASTRRESKSVECQASLTWVFSNVHLGRLGLMCVLLADPDRYRPELRRASPLSVLRRQGFSRSPQKRPLRVPPIPTK